MALFLRTCFSDFATNKTITLDPPTRLSTPGLENTGASEYKYRGEHQVFNIEIVKRDYLGCAGVCPKRSFTWPTWSGHLAPLGAFFEILLDMVADDAAVRRRAPQA